MCVFDATDRIQHMFWRDIDPAHPAGRGREQAPHRDAIRELYRHNDALVGRVRQQLRDGDVLMVISDHGFSSFRRGVNLNQWLLREGYLMLKPGTDGRSRVAARRGLVRDARLRARPDGHVPQPEGPRSARHCRARRRGGSAQGGD